MSRLFGFRLYWPRKKLFRTKPWSRRGILPVRLRAKVRASLVSGNCSKTAARSRSRWAPNRKRNPNFEAKRARS